MRIIRNLTKRVDEYMDRLLAEIIRDEIRRQLDGTGSQELWQRCVGYVEERFDDLSFREERNACDIKRIYDRLEELDVRHKHNIGLRRDGVRDDEGHRAPRGGV